MSLPLRLATLTSTAAAILQLLAPLPAQASQARQADQSDQSDRATATRIEIVDDSGARLQLPAPAQRIVSLAPHLTEILFAAGAGAQVVGVVSYSDYPPAARALPQVGSYNQLNLEAILALRPDLIVGWQSGNHSGQLERLQALGLPLYVNEIRDFADVAHSLEQLGRLSGHAQSARTAAADFRRRHAELADRYRDQRQISVFYQIWDRPMMTVNGDHLISKVIELCGGRNVFATLPTLTPTVSVEAVLAAAPEAIIASGMDEERPQWLEQWRRWEQLPAARANQLFSIPPDLLQRHTPRILEGAGLLCEQLDRIRQREAR